MNTTLDHIQHHKALLADLLKTCHASVPFNTERHNKIDSDFLDSLTQLSQQVSTADEYLYTGQQLLTYIISHYPHLTPAINRDLLWYFGGDCLHYMTDEEIQQYQQLDELLFEVNESGQSLNYVEAKAKIFKLH